PALMMSGGLDSASIVAMALRRETTTGDDSVHTYSMVGVESGAGSESTAIHSLSHLKGIVPHLFSIDLEGNELGLRDLQEVAWTRAHPIDNSILLPALIFLAASRDGCRVMLHGANGDVTLWTSTRYLAAALRVGRVRYALNESRAARRHHVAWYGKPTAKILAMNAYEAFVPQRVRTSVSAWRYARRRPRQSLLRPDFAERIRNSREARADIDLVTSGSWGDDPESIAEMIMYGMSGFGRVASRYGMEVADPWADRRVVEFFLGLPTDLKVREGWTKYPVRMAFAEDLPAEVLQRRDKEHLGWRLVQRLMGASRDMVADRVRNDLDILQPYVNPSTVQSLFEEYSRTASAALGLQLYELVSLLTWLERVDSHA
ncbi:MAG: asparagine synthase C-terminal domain-containing protein, partial [Lysobacterales bacterium]